MLRLNLAPHTLHFKRPAPTSRGPLAARALWLLRATDARRSHSIGLGECGPIPALSFDDHPDFAVRAQRLLAAIHAAPPLLPEPPSEQQPSLPPHNGIALLDSLLAPWEAQLARLPSLRFGLESALLDLYSGGQGVLFESAFTHGAATLPTHGLIWMDRAEGLLAQVAAKVAAGFNVIKMKVGALPFDDELALLRTLRAHYPAIVLRLDANGAFTPDEAGARLDLLAPLHIEFIEQPIRAGQHAQMATLCATSPIPVVLDEELIGLTNANSLRALLESIRPQGIIIKPALLGGWRAAIQAVAICKELGIAWWANSLLEASPGHDAICQWTAACGGKSVHGLGTGSLYRDNFPSPITLVGNQLQRNAGAALCIHAEIAAA